MMKLFHKDNTEEILAYQQSFLDTHYKEVENMYSQMRRWRHDYRNHIQTMKAFAENEDLEALKAYLNELDNDLEKIGFSLRTGNAMADAILSSKISLAEAKGITVRADAHIPVRLKTSDIDLCCIIGNLFDNAIEASQALPEEKRMIRIYMDMKNTQLYISFTNFTAEKKKTVYSSKKPGDHGHGLVSIDSIIETLDGYISRNSEDGAFTTEILIPQV